MNRRPGRQLGIQDSRKQKWASGTCLLHDLELVPQPLSALPSSSEQRRGRFRGSPGSTENTFLGCQWTLQTRFPSHHREGPTLTKPFLHCATQKSVFSHSFMRKSPECLFPGCWSWPEGTHHSGCQSSPHCFLTLSLAPTLVLRTPDVACSQVPCW